LSGAFRLVFQATTLLAKDFEGDIDIFYRVLALTTIIGDYFSEGIINYFLLQQQQLQPPQQSQVGLYLLKFIWASYRFTS